MTTEKLQNIINQFDENDLKQKGVFGVFQYGGGSDESFIKANKEGLELFAIQLLKASTEIDTILTDKEKNIITLDYDENWIHQNSDTFLQYIEPTTDEQINYPKYEHKTTFADKILPYGCGFLLIIIVISILVGLGTIIKWISN